MVGQKAQCGARLRDVRDANAVGTNGTKAKQVEKRCAHVAGRNDRRGEPRKGGILEKSARTRIARNEHAQLLQRRNTDVGIS